MYVYSPFFLQVDWDGNLLKKILKIKNLVLVAQVFNLCNLSKSPEGICPTGRSLGGFISLPGDAKVEGSCRQRSARSP
jgi:hypothetical protein